MSELPPNSSPETNPDTPSAAADWEASPDQLPPEGQMAGVVTRESAPESGQSLLVPPVTRELLKNMGVRNPADKGTQTKEEARGSINPPPRQ